MKTIRNWLDKDVRAYQDKDLDKLQPLFQHAAELWLTKQIEYATERGDVGTCVLGAGIQVLYMAPRKRKATYKVIIPAPGYRQGACTWEASKNEILELLSKFGVEASYNPGFMD